MAASVLGFVLASGIVGNDKVLQYLGLAASVLSSLGYTAGRSYAKAWGSPSKDLSLTAPVPPPAA